MQKEKIVSLKLDDKLYQYTWMKGPFVYTVIGIREYEDIKLYELECQSCSPLDHIRCKVLVSQNDNENTFKYVSMIGEDEHDEQYYWHNESNYFITLKECKTNAYKKRLKNKKEEIEKLETLLKDKKTQYIEFETVIKNQ